MAEVDTADVDRAEADRAEADRAEVDRAEHAQHRARGGGGRHGGGRHGGARAASGAGRRRSTGRRSIRRGSTWRRSTTGRSWMHAQHRARGEDNDDAAAEEGRSTRSIGRGATTTTTRQGTQHAQHRARDDDDDAAAEEGARDGARAASGIGRRPGFSGRDMSRKLTLRCAFAAKHSYGSLFRAGARPTFLRQIGPIVDKQTVRRHLDRYEEEEYPDGSGPDLHRAMRDYPRTGSGD